jgi:hypothetical protein
LTAVNDFDYSDVSAEKRPGDEGEQEMANYEVHPTMKGLETFFGNNFAAYNEDVWIKSNWCPTCRVGAGRQCVDPFTGERDALHPMRVALVADKQLSR